MSMLGNGNISMQILSQRVLLIVKAFVLSSSCTSRCAGGLVARSRLHEDFSVWLKLVTSKRNVED